MNIKTLLMTAISIFLCSQAGGEIISRNILYQHDDTVLEGHIAYDDSISAPRPGILIFHQWRGLTDYEKMRARMLAELGYVAFAADVYGKGNRAKDNEEAAGFSEIYRKDIKLMRGRANSALIEMKKLKEVDPKRIAAVGYCFGGTVALELIRSGADIAGVVTFHGGLDTPYAKDAHNIKGKVLVLHGASDDVVPPERVAAFQKEMSDASVDWYMVTYAYAEHGFTQKGPNYNAAADLRSWDEMRRFLVEIFGK